MIIHLLLQITDLRPGKSNQFKGKVRPVNDLLVEHKIMKITMAFKRKEDLNVATQVGHTYCLLQSTPALRTPA